MKRTKLADRQMPVYTKGEEIFNMVSHIVGGAMGILAIVICAVLQDLMVTFTALLRAVYSVRQCLFYIHHPVYTMA